MHHQCGHGAPFEAAYSGIDAQFSPWKSNYEGMAKKTLIKQVLKYAPIKADFRRALATDETVKTQLGPDMGELSDETVWDGEYQEEV